MFTTSYPMIGIIGGMGPTAGADLFNKIVANTIANKDQDHLPTLLASLPHEIVDRTRYLLKLEESNPAYSMAKLTLWLEKAGATHCAIPCNTAHSTAIWTVLQEELKKANSKVIFIHILEELKKEVEQRFGANNGKKPRLGLLSTHGTRKMGTYAHYFNESKYDLIYPTDPAQEKCMDAIYNEEYGIKACPSKVTDQAIRQLHEAMQDLKKQEVDAFILGCTELSFGLIESSYYDIPCIDPVNIQARALIRATYPDKLLY